MFKNLKKVIPVQKRNSSHSTVKKKMIWKKKYAKKKNLKVFVREHKKKGTKVPLGDKYAFSGVPTDKYVKKIKKKKFFLTKNIKKGFCVKK